MNLSFLGKAHYPPAEFPRFSVDPDKCTRCGRCVKTCPTHVLVLPEDGPPVVQGYKGLTDPCLGCANCMAVCKEGAALMEGNYRVSAGRYRTLFQGRVEPPNPFGEPEPPRFEDLEGRITETERVMLTRRSVRLFKKKEVPEEMIHRCLEAGRFAPSSGNGMCWEFVVITDRDLMRRIEQSCLKSIRMATNLYLKPKSLIARAAWNLLSLRRAGDMDVRVISGMETVARRDQLFFNAPALIVVLHDQRGIGQPVLDAGICAQNIVIAAHAMGLGTCYVGFITALNQMPDRKVMKEIGAVWPMRICTSIAVGWPKGEIDRPAPRARPKVTWIKKA